jgi:hypothetical protein
MDDDHPSGVIQLAFQRFRATHGIQISVHSYQARVWISRLEYPSRMATATERTIKVRPAGTNAERIDRFVEHDRRMGMIAVRHAHVAHRGLVR